VNDCQHPLPVALARLEQVRKTPSQIFLSFAYADGEGVLAEGKKYRTSIPQRSAELQAIGTSTKADYIPRRATFYAVACDACDSRHTERRGASIPNSSAHRQSSRK
jgi:hypothetical protein